MMLWRDGIPETIYSFFRNDYICFINELANMTRVAIQGYRGCFHEQAARLFYSARGEEISILECPTFEDLFVALSDGSASAAIMAIENTISGGLLPNCRYRKPITVPSVMFMIRADTSSRCS